MEAVVRSEWNSSMRRVCAGHCDLAFFSRRRQLRHRRRNGLALVELPAMSKLESRAFTLVELLVVIAIIGILIAAIAAGRASSAAESARRTQCMNSLKQIGLGLFSYESAKKVFPPGRKLPDFAVNGVEQGGTSYTAVSPSSTVTKTGFYSVHTWLLPFMEEKAIYDSINFTYPITSVMENPKGTIANASYAAYASAAGLFICPSDGDTGAIISENNYRYNFGGATPYGGWVAPGNMQLTPDNGAFTIGRSLRVKDFPDGLSKTAFFAERTKGSLRKAGAELASIDDVHHSGQIRLGVTDVNADVNSLMSSCINPPTSPDSDDFMAMGRWDRDQTQYAQSFTNGWPIAGFTSTCYNHVAHPELDWLRLQRTSNIADTPGEHALISARSKHPGVVNVCFGDGHVTSVPDSIDLQIWRALGTRNGGETIQGFQ